MLGDYLQPMGIKKSAMARSIGVPPQELHEIVHGNRPIRPPMSIRFGALFGQSEDFWHEIQVECGGRALRHPA